MTIPAILPDRASCDRYIVAAFVVNNKAYRLAFFAMDSVGYAFQC